MEGAAQVSKRLHAVFPKDKVHEHLGKSYLDLARGTIHEIRLEIRQTLDTNDKQRLLANK